MFSEKATNTYFIIWCYSIGIQTTLKVITLIITPPMRLWSKEKDERTNDAQQNTTQKTKDWATHTRLTERQYLFRTSPVIPIFCGSCYFVIFVILICFTIVMFFTPFSHWSFWPEYASLVFYIEVISCIFRAIFNSYNSKFYSCILTSLRQNIFDFKRK